MHVTRSNLSYSVMLNGHLTLLYCLYLFMCTWKVEPDIYFNCWYLNICGSIHYYIVYYLVACVLILFLNDCLANDGEEWKWKWESYRYCTFLDPRGCSQWKSLQRQGFFYTLFNTHNEKVNLVFEKEFEHERIQIHCVTKEWC